MIDNHELPIGFTMELAQHSDILNRFAALSHEEQERYIDGSREVETSTSRSQKAWDLSIILNEASRSAAASGPFWIIGS